MTIADWIGSVGVLSILVAFFLNASQRLSSKNIGYICMNLVGGGLACFASYLIGYWPFVVLEGTWALVSLWALFRWGQAYRNSQLR